MTRHGKGCAVCAIGVDPDEDGHQDLSGPDDPSKLYHGYTIEYDGDKGEIRKFGAGIDELIQVRARMEEDILRQAVIIELEKLGYTVIPPEEEA